jgi:hypothetical protein
VHDMIVDLAFVGHKHLARHAFVDFGPRNAL